MGLGGIKPISLVLLLLIIVTLFGTSKLKSIGTDLGQAIKNFRRALQETEDDDKKS